MATYAILFGGYALVGAAALILQVLAGGLTSAGDVWGALGLAAMMLGVLAISVMGLVAIVTFARVALRFWRQGRIGLMAEHRRFLQGMLFAAPALVVMLPFGWLAVAGQHPVDKLMAFYASGIALLPPILHLWLELRGRPAQEASA